MLEIKMYALKNNKKMRSIYAQFDEVYKEILHRSKVYMPNLKIILKFISVILLTITFPRTLCHLGGIRNSRSSAFKLSVQADSAVRHSDPNRSPTSYPGLHGCLRCLKPWENPNRNFQNLVVCQLVAESKRF